MQARKMDPGQQRVDLLTSGMDEVDRCQLPVQPQRLALGSGPAQGLALPGTSNRPAGEEVSGSAGVQMLSSSSANDLLNINMGNEVNFYTYAPVHPSSMEHLKDKMRLKLRFFFMNPVEKWQAKGRFPYKLLVQVFKIFMVTLQLCLFASHRYAHVSYSWDNKVTFSHLFVKDWDPAREVSTYPPSVGPLAIYSKQMFYDYIDHAVNSYINIKSLAITPYSYASKNGSIAPLNMCMRHYKKVVIFGFNESFIIDSKVLVYALLEARLKFTLKTVSLHDVAANNKSPDCYRFDIMLLFDNSDYDGQMLVTLDADASQLYCNGDVEYIADNKYQSAVTSAVNIFVILMCTVSLLLCCRAIYRAQQLKWEAVQFFKEHFDKRLSVTDRLEFLNFWYVMMIVDDILIIVGSGVKEKIERRLSMGDSWNLCSVLLGVGNLLVWFGVLRYLGFFKTYNVLILTLKRAAPNVLRFLLCCVLIYLGFVFCGWLILSPYHIKFRTLYSTSECLFSLTNGDDMFATFASMSSKSNLLWWFSRIYLYSFISLFIYIVLSLFIALIMDAYETIKQYYVDGFPCSPLQEFIAECPIPANSGYFRSTRQSKLRVFMHKVRCTLCPERPSVINDEEVEPLMA